MAQVVIGAKITADTNGANDSVKSFRAQLREAQADVVKLSNEFGATSKQAAEAAKKAADLRDRIGDAKNLVAAFNPDQKFASFGKAITGVVGGLTAVHGLMGLVGSDSEDVQKALLKVQSALALSQGINQLGELKDSLSNVFSVIKNNLGTSLPLIAAGIGIIILKLTEWKREQTELDKINEAAIASTVEQRTKLELLTKAAQDTGKSTKYRLDQVKELQKEFPGYFDNIKTEKDLNDKLTTAYNNASVAILAKAKATAAFNQIVKNENEILEIQKKTQDYADEFKDYKGYEADIARVKKVNDERIAVIRKANEELSKVFTDPPPPPPKPLSDAELKAISDKEKQKAQAAAEAKLFWEDVAKQKNAEQAAKNTEGIGGQVHNNGISQLTVEDQTIIDSTKLRTAIERGESEERIRQAQAEADMKIALADQIGAATGALADLVGRQTVAGKVLALAQIAEGVGVGFIHALRIAQQSATATGPAAAFAFPVFYASQVAAVLAAAAKAKSVLSSGSGDGGSVNTGTGAGGSAPVTPQLSTTTTQLQAVQNQINNNGNAAVKAYVVTTDINNDQEKIARINRAARIG